MPVGKNTVFIITGRTQEGFMHSENIIYKNEMNEKTTKFLDKFVKRVKGNPPGVCPIAVQLSFYKVPEVRPAVNVFRVVTDWNR